VFSNRALCLKVATLEMRAMLCQMHLFNNASQKLDKTFILNGKALEVGKIEREKEK
jgi:hypothetical protein